LPVRKALETAREIAEALETAHKQKIVHRDLKPSNIMLTPEGHVKVMDFGLAKELNSIEGQEEEITTALTQDGSLLGTLPYMSPEQVLGHRVDTRSDRFSFGVVLYEMLSGVNPFKGDTSVDTAHAILNKTVPSLTRYTEDIPVLLQHTVKKMLAKEPDRRFQSVHEVRTDLGELIEEGGDSIGELAAAPSEAVSATGGWQRTIPWSIAVVAVVLAVIIAFWSSPEPLSPLSTKFVITPSPATSLANSAANDLAISANGRHILYRANNARGVQLYLHSLDDLVDRPIPGTEGIVDEMFFSPDGESVAFFGGSELKRVSLIGGSPVTICEAGAPWRTGSWGSEETIVFSASSELGVIQLYRVLASGGEPEILATPDLDKGETGYVSPQILPGGKALLFTINHDGNSTPGAPGSSGGGGSQQIAALSLETREQKILIEDGRQPTYVKTGHLIYEQAATGNLMAVPFDLARLEVASSPVPVLQGVRQSALVDYALSDEGTLVYLPRETNLQRLVWVDRKGTESRIIQEEVSFNTPRISPNGEQVAIGITKAGEPQNIWIYDLVSESLRRLTFGVGSVATWSPDGQWIIFRGGDSAGQRAISRQLADGSGPIEHLTVPGVDGLPGSQTPDGSVLAFTRQGGAPTFYDIMMLPMEGDREPQPFITSPSMEISPNFSPDGKWLAYVSIEPGPNHVYVSPYPNPDVKYLVSEEEGGEEPVWSPDGTELFYRSGSRMMVVPVQTDPTFRAGRPEILFEGRYVTSRIMRSIPYYDISPDGQRFLMIKAVEGSTGQINVVLNWFEELKRLVPTEP
ncbi:MAG: protein kinase, partial [Acidobacteriota bacterium]